MKHLALFFLLLTSYILLSCEQDVYEKGDGSYSYMRADFVEAYVGADKQVSRVMTDDDDELTLTAPYMAEWIKRPDTTYRAVLYYNKVENGAEPLKLSRITTLDVISSKRFIILL